MRCLVGDMRRGLVVLALLVGMMGCGQSEQPAPPANPPREGVRVELRVVDRQGQGTALEWQGKQIHVHGPSLISSAEIVDVRSVMNDASPSPAIQLRLDKAAGERLSAATTQLVGQQLAFSVDDRVLTVVTVMGPFGDSMQVTGLDTLQEAADMVRHITGRAPSPSL